MESISEPLRALAEEASWFARDRDVRLLHVVTTLDLRDAVLKIVMGQEFHADNRSPFVRLDDAFTLAEAGWPARTRSLREQHEARVEAMKRAGTGLYSLPPERSAKEPLVAFAVQVRDAAACSAPALESLVVVLAPTRIEDPAGWRSAMIHLVADSEVSGARWVVVELDEASLSELVEALGPSAMSVTCKPDDAAVDRELAQMIDRAASAPEGATGHALSGAAWPPVAPPRRIGRVDEGDETATLEAAGFAPGITARGGRTLRTLILRGAQAMKAKRGDDALRFQRAARDWCWANGQSKEGVLMDIILGSYLVQLGDTPAAIEAYERASERAEESGMLKEAAQGRLALGAVFVVLGRRAQASTAYAQAGRLAHAGGVPVLAIEAFRLAGQFAEGDLKVALWDTALKAAGGLPGPELASSSAVETARSLAAFHRDQGRSGPATQAEGVAVSFEAVAQASAPASAAPASPAT